MSEVTTDSKTPPAEGKKDDTAASITNLKGEFDRKIGNLEKTNQNILATLQSLVKPAPKPKADPSQDLDKLIYDDPKEYTRRVKEMAKNETMAELSAQNTKTNKVNNVIAGLYADFPELQDVNHDLTKKAVEIYEKFTEEEKQSPLSYKLAVKDAAEELGVQPKKKRAVVEDDDNFSLGGGSAGTRTTKTKSEKLDPRTIEFAKLMGLDTDDQKVMDSLKKRAQRRDWGRWT